MEAWWLIFWLGGDKVEWLVFHFLVILECEHEFEQ